MMRVVGIAGAQGVEQDVLTAGGCLRAPQVTSLCGRASCASTEGHAYEDTSHLIFLSLAAGFASSESSISKAWLKHTLDLGSIEFGLQRYAVGRSIGETQCIILESPAAVCRLSTLLHLCCTWLLFIMTLCW